MDKKLLVFSIFVSLFILGGLSFASAANVRVIHSYGAITDGGLGARATNTSFGSVVSGSSVVLLVNVTNAAINATHYPTNMTLFYNTSMTVFARATLTGVTGNTTCSSTNYCWNSSTGIGGTTAKFLVTWTPPSTDGATLIIGQFRWRSGVNRTWTNFSTSKSIVSVDDTKPTVTLVGNVTDGYVFTSLSRFSKGYAGAAQEQLFLAKVVDHQVRNCTLWTEFGFNQKNTFGANKTGLNTITAYRGFLNDSTAGAIKFWNATPHFVGAVPNEKYKWGVTCFDNASVPNYGVASANRSFYFDNKTPKMAATNPLTFEDSDPNAKDTSTSGLFRIGGVWTSELLETLTFTCDVTEANLVNVKFLIKRPGSTVFDLEKLSTKKTLEFTDTSKTGIYEIKCITTDIAGNATTSTTAKFRLQSEDEGEVPGTAAYVKPFNVDFSKVDSKNIVEPQGRILTVSFDGQTEHTVNFQRVTATSVTLIITSTPKTLNLNIGDTKNVDVNDDGVDDFAVSLVSVVEGKANVAFKKLTGAAQVAREESGQASTTVSGGTGPTTGGRSMTGIWIIVLIVVVGVIIYLVVARRKKK